ncbi:MAG: ABC transporter permease [Bullifex sp.]
MKKHNVSLIAGLILLSVIFMLLIMSYAYLPYRIDQMDIKNRFAMPSSEHLLGTDHFGRDIFSRILVSTRSALTVSVSSVLLGSVCGLILGSLAALSPTAVELVIMRLVDALMAFPGILSALMLSAVLGKGVMNASIAIAFFMVPVFARLSYSMILENRKKLFIKAAKSYGASTPRLVLFHMLPDMMTRLITQFSASVGTAIITESSLSFLGLGIQPPGASLGLMLAEAKGYVLIQPYQALWPGIVLAVAVLGFQLTGDGINTLLHREASHE